MWMIIFESNRTPTRACVIQEHRRASPLIGKKSPSDDRPNASSAPLSHTFATTKQHNKATNFLTMSSTPELQMMSPITIGGQELKNRIVLAPMTRARCTPTEDPLDPANTNPNDLMVEYYTQRASGGLIISEATAISELGSGWLNAPHIRTADNVAGWKKVVDSVHAAGGLMYLQLWHMGRYESIRVNFLQLKLCLFTNLLLLFH
jgi:hypothetical protein